LAAVVEEGVFVVGMAVVVVAHGQGA